MDAWMAHLQHCSPIHLSIDPAGARCLRVLVSTRALGDTRHGVGEYIVHGTFYFSIICIT